MYWILYSIMWLISTLGIYSYFVCIETEDCGGYETCVSFILALLIGAIWPICLVGLAIYYISIKLKDIILHIKDEFDIKRRLEL